jgi:hypothetical protein
MQTQLIQRQILLEIVTYATPQETFGLDTHSILLILVMVVLM